MNLTFPILWEHRTVLVFVGRHGIKKRYYGRDSSAYNRKSSADREKGLCHCLEEDGLSLENWKLWHLKGKKERKPHANLSCCCEPWKPLFKILLIYFLKPVIQPLLRGIAPNYLCFNLSHCSSSLQFVLEDPAFCCTHGNMCILGNLPNYLSTKCQHFTFYYWRGNNVSQLLFIFGWSFCFGASVSISDWSQTHRYPLASDSQVLGLWA